MSIEYLSKYLTKDAGSKKRKRVTTQIIEDDLSGWTNSGAVEADASAPVVVEQTIRKSAGFAPAYVKDESLGSEFKSEDHSRAGATMQNGTRAGLQTREEMAAQMKVKEELDNKEFQQMRNMASLGHQETVYRDATGRRIDIGLMKQQKARDLRREEDKRRMEDEMTQGLVQQREKLARESDLRAVRSEGFSRYAGDAQTEAAMRSRRQWNDPAAPFLSSDLISKRAKPIYSGGFAPNRFGIRPGYRWDGVDRGNGYEAKRFKAVAALQQRKSEYDDWAKEDM